RSREGPSLRVSGSVGWAQNAGEGGELVPQITQSQDPRPWVCLCHRVCVCVCVCGCVCRCLCGCVCVRDGESSRERERESQREKRERQSERTSSWDCRVRVKRELVGENSLPG